MAAMNGSFGRIEEAREDRRENWESGTALRVRRTRSGTSCRRHVQRENRRRYDSEHGLWPLSRETMTRFSFLIYICTRGMLTLTWRYTDGSRTPVVRALTRHSNYMRLPSATL